jgi:hypothetical protein
MWRAPSRSVMNGFRIANVREPAGGGHEAMGLVALALWRRRESL